jgi:hypothetical protein
MPEAIDFPFWHLSFLICHLEDGENTLLLAMKNEK